MDLAWSPNFYTQWICLIDQIDSVMKISRALDSQEVKLDQFWPKHGLKMARVWSHKKDNPLRCPEAQVESVLKFKSSSYPQSKARLNVVPTWSKHGPKDSTLSGHDPQTKLGQS